MMKISDTAKAYNKIIQKRFNTIQVIYVSRSKDADDVRYCALGISSSDRSIFMDFVFDELAPALRKDGFEFNGITPYSIEETQRLFPKIWQDMKEAVGLVNVPASPEMQGQEHKWKSVRREEIVDDFDNRQKCPPASTYPIDGRMPLMVDNDNFTLADKPPASEEWDIAA
jgi:hypothetical protein